MRPFDLIRSLAGLAALVALLALGGPGVKAVRAEGGASESAQCRVSAGSSDAEIQAFLQELRREQIARVAEGGSEIVVLNGRGYNYGPPRGPMLDLIRAEAAAAQRPQ